MTAIVTAEILFKYSTKVATAGNQLSSTALASLGLYVSTTQWTGSVLNDLFDDISGPSNAASQVDYRCLFIHNSNTANAYTGVGLWLSAETAGGASIAIAADTTAASALAASTAQALTAASATAPGAGVTGLTYVSPTSFATALSLGTIGVGQVKAFWVRRTAANTAALSSDGVSLSVQGDTGSL